MGNSRRIYRWLLKLYPARFREEYSGPLERQFLDDYRHARGPLAYTMFWIGALGDVAASLPREILREMRQDLHYAARIYRKRSFVTALALVALALAIGGTTGVFSVLNALLLRGLPFRDPERLVALWNYSPVNPWAGRPAFETRRHARPYLEDATVFVAGFMSLNGTGDATRVRVTETPANFFDVLGSTTAFGRFFVPDEDIAGPDHIAVISFSLWQRFFGGDPRTLGSTIHVNGVPLTVIGVARAGLDYPARTDVWTPTVFDGELLPKTGAFTFETIGRLKPGVTLRQAQGMFLGDAQRTNPESLTRSVNRARITPIRDELAGKVRDASWVLLGLVAFVLLIACANVAQLLLTRISERRQELAVRAALGASRARLVQQLITEAMVLTLTASAAGLMVARWAAQLVSVVQPSALGSQSYTDFDWRVVGFAVAVALLTGLIFGVLPAYAIGRMQPSQETMRSQQTAARSGVARLRFGLVILQAALTVILVAGSVSLGRSFLKLLKTDMGFDADHVVTLNVSLAGTPYKQSTNGGQYYRDALERIRSVPGVESAGGLDYLPLIDAEIYVGERLKLAGGPEFFVRWNTATPEYFKTMRTAVVAGREFDRGDQPGNPQPVVINEAFVRESGANGLVGKEVASAQSNSTYRIVGVVKNQFPAVPTLYTVAGAPGFITFVARVQGDPNRYLAALRDAVQQVDRKVPIYDVKTLEHRLSDHNARPRFYTTVVSFFGGFALLLAVIGIYGVSSYSISQRTKEIGVRIAVGASPGGVRGMLLKESLLPLTAGMGVGVLASMGLGQSLQRLIEAAEPVGAWTCAAAAVLLIVTGTVAVWRATARVVRIDPMTALRAE